MNERLYDQAAVDEMLERANQDGIQAGASEAGTAYREGFNEGYAAAVEDQETGELKGAAWHLNPVGASE